MAEDWSRGSRKGTIVGDITYGNSDGKTPFAAFCLKSEIDIGGEISVETANVLLVGNALEVLKKAAGVGPGTLVYLNACLLYLRVDRKYGKTLLCFRATDADQVSFENAEPTMEKPHIDYVDAKDYFNKGEFFNHGNG